MSPRHWLFVGLCLVSVAVLAAYVLHAQSRLSARSGPSPATPLAEIVPDVIVERLPVPAADDSGAVTAVTVMTAAPEPVAEQAPRPAVAPPPPAVPRVFFRHNGLDGDYGRLAVVSANDREQRRFVGDFACEVVYVAAGRGICLMADRGVFTTYRARLFELGTGRSLTEFSLAGPPSRARVSADGRFAALTVFVTGHSYTSVDFSTQTLLLDVERAEVMADVQRDFVVRRDGRVIREEDFNFWGVTFTPDARHFYATLSTAGRHYLIKGDIQLRTADVVHDDVECPSVSPAGERVAFKRRRPGLARVEWDLRVLDLATGQETLLPERRSVDDQLEWVDEDHVLYTLPAGEGDGGASTDVWLSRVASDAAPRLYLRSAYSPAMLR